MIAIHLNAGNNANGNPRRIYVVLDADANIVGTVDEGYEGNARLKREYPGVKIGPTFATSPAEYRDLCKHKRAK